MQVLDLKRLSTVDEQFLEVMSLRNRKKKISRDVTQALKEVSGSAAAPSIVH